MHEVRLWTLTQAARLLSVTQTLDQHHTQTCLQWARCCADPTFDLRSQQSRTGHIQFHLGTEHFCLPPAIKKKKKQPENLCKTRFYYI